MLAALFRVVPFDVVGDRVVERLLLLVRLEGPGPDLSVGEVDRGVVALVPDHHPPELPVERPRVLHPAVVGNVPRFELGRRAEEARPDQVRDVVEVRDVVLDRRGRREERVVVVDVLDELVALGPPIPQVVCLVDDQRVPVASLDLPRVVVQLRRVDAGDDPVVLGEALERVVVATDEVEHELLAHLPPPLRRQLRRREDQEGVVGVPERHLLQHHPDLDGLSQADLVGEERLAVHLEERPVGRVKLVVQQLDLVGDRLDGLQLLPALGDREPSRLDVEQVTREVVAVRGPECLDDRRGVLQIVVDLDQPVVRTCHLVATVYVDWGVLKTATSPGSIERATGEVAVGVPVAVDERAAGEEEANGADDPRRTIRELTEST